MPVKSSPSMSVRFSSSILSFQNWAFLGAAFLNLPLPFEKPPFEVPFGDEDEE